MTKVLCKFTALPVGQGDAFLWQSSDQSVLVDGGRRDTAAYERLVERGVRYLNVVVCTHADKDHINGLIEVLHKIDYIGEVWLPARWGNKLDEVARDPAAILTQLAHECATSSLQGLEDAQERRAETDEEQTAMAVQTGYPLAYSEPDEESRAGEVDLLAVSELIGGAPNSLGQLIASAHSWLHWPKLGPRWQSKLWLEAIDTLSLVWRVVQIAVQRGAILRWFEYEPAPQAHGIQGEPWLNAANATEILKVRRMRGVLEWLCLSLKNEEALVFLGEFNDSRLLFSSDSDFTFQMARVPVDRPMLVTVPHHGSKANATAIFRILDHTREAASEHCWIRSDTAAASRPCQEFLDIASQRRGCTGCLGCARSSAPVTAEAQGKTWKITKGHCSKPGATK